jgi:hypothetical protein
MVPDELIAPLCPQDVAAIWFMFRMFFPTLAGAAIAAFSEEDILRYLAAKTGCAI